MATTTNYSWTTPDDTALVKDGALAIRTLGSSVDTTVKNLNPETTTGAIAYRGATANQKVALPIGTAGQVLTVNSGATAPEWATISSGGMTLISTTTLSGATVTLSSIPATYKHLHLIISGVTANTSNNRIRILPNNVNNLSAAAAARGFASGSDTQPYINDCLYPWHNQNSLRTNADNVAQVTIFNYASASYFKSFFTTFQFIGTDSNSYFGITGGAFSSSTAISSLVIDYGGTNTFSAGQVLFYGVN